MDRIFRFFRRSLLALCMLLGAMQAKANNIQTTNGVLTGNNGTQMFVQFDLSWENSWRIAPDRWDAAWVFVKYRSSDGLWRHASLDNSGHVAPGGASISAGLVDPTSAYNASTNPAVGVFIYRSTDGSGTFTANGLQLLWNYSADGVVAADVQEVQVFAIEMVYVPQGAFAAGSGGTENFAFTLTTINTANATTVPSGTGSLGGQAGGFPTGQTAPTNASWPNGFNAFYSMKYEVTQQGYVDFLNTLTYPQQVTRTAFAPNSAASTAAVSNSERNGIAIQTPGVASSTPAMYACNLNGNTSYGEATDGKDIACNYLSWGDLTAYLDWSGLRPMTELEFEKASRGTAPPVANEYPWGTASVTAGFFIVNSQGSANEGIAFAYSTTLGNASYNSTIGPTMAIPGPLRVGIFAANGSNNGRITAGASYYGILELGGNVWEHPVNISNLTGRGFNGTHGNGILAADGQPNVATWPSPTTADGAGLRGGSWSDEASLMLVSDRLFTDPLQFSDRDPSLGGRGVRTAP